jgi:hypothetical protein
VVALNTYSFLDTRASISGPGGNFQLGQDAGIADEGISFEMIEDKGSLITGASGDAMHVLHAGKAGRVTIRLLKTSVTNAMLNQMYELQSGSPRRWGQNTILCTTPLGDNISAKQAAFVRWPNNSFAKTAAIIEWQLVCAQLDGLFGTGAAG